MMIQKKLISVDAGYKLLLFLNAMMNISCEAKTNDRCSNNLFYNIKLEDALIY